MTTTSILTETGPSEFGAEAAAAIADILARTTAGASISTFIEGDPPVEWSALGDWDLLGRIEDGESASLRDLVEFALRWGYSCVQLPLMTTILAKRHSEKAAQTEGPLTFSVLVDPESGVHFAPFGQIEGIGFLASDEEEGVVRSMPAGEPVEFAPTLRGAFVTTGSTLTSEFRHELAVLWGAEAVGAARRLLDDSVAYVGQRKQFGRPIGSFQAVKHRLADALISLESAEAAVVWASLDAERAPAAVAFAVERSILVAEAAIQVHGGLGFTWEMGLHFYLKHMLQIRDLLPALLES